MLGVVTVPSPTKSVSWNFHPRICFPDRNPPNKIHTFPRLSTFPARFSLQKHTSPRTHFSPKAAASSEYTEEPSTKVKFQTSLSLPGCSSALSLLGTAPLEKSLDIVLVRDVDGKTFWDALDDAVSPRIKSPTPVDESALSTFRSIFQGRPLKKRTSIFLTWLDPTKMLVCVSADGMPSGVDATIESTNVTFALYDVFFGGDPVSPSLKASVANGLATVLNV
ncbi:hypothetical protein RJ639_013087 [Escallonia herrerae]|uniref:Chalcone-flavonone isomerase family protein n=1 Tax=Escallonia herrerae TaxID=1293975 RepID=A0AA88VI23_9ASTE|nr:hypothetical protein RJ639_013087 [Escallonia herrerae]